MYAKWLVILGILMLSSTATADQIAARGGRLELRVESREEMLESIEVAENRYATLKSFSERARIDRKSGLRFNVLKFEDGILKELGLSNQDSAETEIYLMGPYVSGKPGLSFMIRF